MTFIIDSIVFLGHGALIYTSRELRIKQETTITVNLPYPGEVDFETEGFRVVDWKKDTFHYAALQVFKRLKNKEERLRREVDSLSAVVESYNLNKEQLKATVKQIENGKLAVNSPFLARVRSMYLNVSMRLISLEKKLEGKKNLLSPILDSLKNLERLKNFGSIAFRVKPFEDRQKISLVIYSERPSYTPQYEFDVKSSSFSGKLRIKALVNLAGDNPLISYRTRRIIFSTRPAVFRVERPRPTPWYIDVIQPIPLKSRIAPVGGVAKGMESFVEPEMPPVKVRRSFIGMEFVVSGDRKLRYAGVNHVDIKDYRVDLKPHYYAYPRVSGRVFILAEFRNDLVDMAPGKAVFYIDGKRVGETSVPYIPEGDVDTLTVGYDPSIHVERRIIDKTLDRKGLFGKKRILEKRKYRTMVKNNKNRDVNLLLYFNIPIPRHADIKVEKYDINVPYRKLDNGIIEASVDVPAGGSISITESIEVSYPSDLRVVW